VNGGFTWADASKELARHRKRVKKWTPCTRSKRRLKPETGQIIYLSTRYEFTAEQLNDWIRGHCTILIDVRLLRLPVPDVFKIDHCSP
jgi:hypothetical protein